jgi:hypothetical protein
VASDPHRLQETLIASLRREPLLIGAERLLHSGKLGGAEDHLRTDLARLLDSGVPIAEFDHRHFRRLDSQTIGRFRAAMQQAVAAGANLGEVETRILESFGMTKVGELTSSIQAHLGSPAELPERTLAIYVPGGVSEGEQEFHEALQRDLQALESVLEDQAEGAVEAAEINRARPDGGEDLSALPGASAGVDGENHPGGTLTIVSTGKSPGKLNPIPMLTAALEAIGSDGRDFGFVLRFGRYAPEGRTSQFLIGGLGLADLSRRLTNWLEAKGPLEGQVQVIDEGSGELTVYLLVPEVV